MDGVRERAGALAEQGPQASLAGAAGPAPEPRKAYKNVEMDSMIAALEGFLKYRGKVGYAAARNTRILRECAREYLERKDELIRRYGEPELGEDGEPTGRLGISAQSPRVADFEREIEEWALIEHKPDIYTIPVGEAMDVISGEEMLAAEWMFTGWEEE